MIKTKLLIEIDIETQFGPKDAVSVIGSLTRVPAISSVVIKKIDSEWRPDENTFPENENFRMLQNIPFKLR